MRLRKINAKTSLFFSVILGSRLQVCVSKLRKSVRDLKSTWQHFENYDYASRKAIGNCALFPLWSPLWSCTALTAIEIMGWLSDFLFLTEFWLRNPEEKNMLTHMQTCMFQRIHVYMKKTENRSLIFFLWFYCQSQQYRAARKSSIKIIQIVSISETDCDWRASSGNKTVNNDNIKKSILMVISLPFS